LELNSCCSFESSDYPIENRNLIMTISIKCLKLTRLTIDVDPRNLNELGIILTNCTQLENIDLTTNAMIIPNGDALLRIMGNLPLNNLRGFSFIDQWNLSLEGLETFLLNWKHRRRSPIAFKHYFDELPYSWTDNHDSLVKKYKDEGVIE
jgi:hypothetical protein